MNDERRQPQNFDQRGEGDASSFLEGGWKSEALGGWNVADFVEYIPRRLA